MPHPEWAARDAAVASSAPTHQPASPDTPAFYATVRALLDYLLVQTGDLRILGDTRFEFGADHIQSDRLLESERALTPPVGAAGPSRTLLPQTSRLTLNGLVSGELVGAVSSTFSARYQSDSSRSLLVSTQGTGDRRDLKTRSGHLGGTLGGRTGGFQWSLTANHDRTRTTTTTDADDAPRLVGEARSTDVLTNADLVASGSPIPGPSRPGDQPQPAQGPLSPSRARQSVGSTLSAQSAPQT